MRIAHVSDIHTASPPTSVSAFFDKRLLGTLNHALRRRFIHDQSLLPYLTGFVLGMKPDVVVVTGDITSTGQPAEFAAALKALRPIIDDKSVETIYVPGNHDAYVRDKRCAASLAETFSILNTGAPELDFLPFVKTIRGIDFILVNEAFPTNIFLSSGKITNETTDAVEEICSAEKKSPRVIVGHFPLRQQLSRRHCLVNKSPLLKLLDNGVIDLSLCGHTHNPKLDLDDKGRGEATAGSFTKTRDVNMIDYLPETDRFTVESKRY
ncbi:MAG: metallophosphoesterase [Kiritimatiellaeota bacterium]|nr:metallophosphoesterase [Kiritimatiellota bacterium]